VSEPLTIALVGCGGMMGAHKRGYEELWKHELRNFRIIATCDIDEQKAQTMAEEIAAFQESRPTAYPDLDALLAGEPELAAVDISTVHRNHHTLAIPCLEAGKHVTIEKPLAITMRAGRMMLDAAEKAGTVFQVAENYRRSPQQRAVRWVLQEGRIGELRMVFWIDVGERLWYWTWREHRDQAGGGWPLDGGVHFADLFRYHIGPVADVYCECRAFHPVRYKDEEKREGRVEVDVEDTVFGTLQFENGVLGEWISTNAAPGHHWSRRCVYGAEGSIDWGAGLKTRTEEKSMEELTEEYMAQLGEDESERLFPRGITDTVATELHEFIETCHGRAELETDGFEGFRAEAICFALYESAELGRPVSVQDIEDLKLEGYQQDLNEGLGLQ
jgi:1,5-anhydro-D-fructose reductase (1,5-anhydro-D-mannitol-forming)